MTHSVFAAPKTPTKNKLNDTGCKSLALVLTSGLLLLGCSQNSSEAAQSATSNAGPTQLTPQATVPAGEFLIKARGKGEVPTAWGFNGYGLARSQADAMDVEKLRTIASEHFQLDMDT